MDPSLTHYAHLYGRNLAVMADPASEELRGASDVELAATSSSASRAASLGVPPLGDPCNNNSSSHHSSAPSTDENSLLALYVQTGGRLQHFNGNYHVLKPRINGSR